MGLLLGPYVTSVVTSCTTWHIYDLSCSDLLQQIPANIVIISNLQIALNSVTGKVEAHLCGLAFTPGRFGHHQRHVFLKHLQLL